MSDIPDLDETPINPDEVTLEESEHVVALEDDRYLVSPSVIDPSTADDIREATKREPTDGDVTSSEMDLDQARSRIASSVQASDSNFSIEFSAMLEGTQKHHRSETDDVVEAFDALLSAFASGVGGPDIPVNEVIAILLTESRRFEPSQSHDMDDVLDAYDLGPDDRIGDLIRAVEQEKR